MRAADKANSTEPELSPASRGLDLYIVPLETTTFSTNYVMSLGSRRQA